MTIFVTPQPGSGLKPHTIKQDFISGKDRNTVVDFFCIIFVALSPDLPRIPKQTAFGFYSK